MKKTLIVVLSALLPLMAWAQTKPTAGNGTPDNPYQIATAEQLVWFQELINGNSSEGAEPNTGACAKLTANIDLSQVCSPTKGGWVAIGLNGAHPYKGTFDGQGHTISNLYADWDDEKPGSWGLFNYVDGATLKNVRFNNVTIAHPNSSAALVFTASNCEISDIVLEGQVRGLWFYGIAANIDHATLSRCANYSNLSRATCERYVDGPMGFGGIAGHTREVKVTDCVFDGTVTMDYAHDVTGLVADAQVSVEISNCLVGGSFNLAKSTKEPSEYQYVQSLFAYVNGTSPNVLVKNCFVDERFSVTYGGEAVSQENVLGSLMYGPPQFMEYNMYSRAYWASASDLSSGKIAFMLQDGREESVWGQTLSSQAKPVLGGKQVYVNSGSLNCAGMPKAGTTFTNTVKPAPAMDSHVANGDRCGKCFKTFLPEKGADDWYEVGDAFELNALVRFQVNPRPMPYKIRLTADIDLSPICNETLGGWMPIGVDSDSPFTGTFDGQGHTISHLYFDNSARVSAFFGYVKDADIRNVKFDGVTFTSNSSSSAVCLWEAQGDSHIADVEITGDITATTGNFAGIANTVKGNTILERCVNRASFTNANNTNTTFGGIASYLGESGTIRDCMYLGNATMNSTTSMAGIVVTPAGNSRLENCLSAGSLKAMSSPIPFESASAQIFGLIHIGKLNDAIVLRCFADTRSSVVFNEHKLTQEELSLSYNTGKPTYGEKGGAEAFVSASDLSSGKVAFLLQNNRKETVWGQTLGTETMPHLGGKQVYATQGGYTCDGLMKASSTFSNTPNGTVLMQDDHTFSDGTGYCINCHTLQPFTHDAEGWYMIYNAEHLKAFATMVNEEGNYTAKGKLMADIDLYNVDLTSIGATEPFRGMFDGQNHTISHFYSLFYSAAYNKNYMGGLFAFVNGATIKNLTVDGNRKAHQCGLIVGRATGECVFQNLIARGQMEGASVAGLFGSLACQEVGKQITVENCYNYATVIDTGNYEASGIAGNAQNVSFYKCANYGTVTGKSAFGINSRVGFNVNYYAVANYGEVTGQTMATGITAVGQASPKRFEGVLNMGNISATTQNAGCFFTNIYDDFSFAKDCYYGPDVVITRNGEVATDTQGTKATQKQVESGELAFMLNGKSNDPASMPWGQTLGKDKMPIIGGAPVYATLYLNCKGLPAEEIGYNLSNEGVPASVKYNGDGHFPGEDGRCIFCGNKHNEDGQIVIENLEDLLAFRDYVATHSGDIQAQGGYNVLQTADIDLSSYCHPANGSQPEVNWKPILNPGVYGTYDGGGHTIRGLYINDPSGTDAPYASFFGFVGYNGAYFAEGKITRIKNLTIEGDITSGIDCAIFGGGGQLAFFENCTSRGTINYNAITGLSYVAGIMGKGKNCTFTNCHNKANITAVSMLNGNNFYAGVAIQGIFERCTNTGNITVTGGYVGGITTGTVSGNPDGTTAEFCIKNCSNTGNIMGICDLEHGVAYTGAITARITSSAPIVNCWYSCDVVRDATAIPAQGKILTGGLYGSKSNDVTAVVTNCYYNSSKQVSESSVATGYSSTNFRNGHVAYLLGEPWGQHIDMNPSAPKNGYPVLDAYPVYMISSLKYSNFSPSDLNKDGHITVADLTQKIKADEQAGIKAVTEELKAIIDLILEKDE